MLAFLMAVIIIGCASPNPNYNPALPVSGTNPAYLPNTNVTTGVAIGQGVNAVTAPVNPYAPFLDLGLGLAAAIATLIAKRKNDALSQLATSVVAQGASVAQAVTDHASNSPQAEPVFKAINAKLPPDKISTS